MNYAEEKTRIENEIKELTAKLENLKKQEEKEEWKNTLVEKFKEFIESKDFAEVSSVMIELGKVGGSTKSQKTFYFSDFFNEPENTAKVETEPTAEPTAEETNEPAEKPENKIVICSVPKPNETPEEKPVKMKMTLDEFIDSLPEPAQK